MDTIFWSRLQFAMTAAYHWLFVPLTLGLALIMAIMETLYVVKKDDFWRKTAQFWMKVFAILRVFFFRPSMAGKTDEEKSETVGNVLIRNHNDTETYNLKN